MKPDEQDTNASNRASNAAESIKLFYYMMTEARISESNLEEALENGTLAEYEAKLIRKIDVEGKGVTEVAGEEQKSKGTISLQHSTALRKLGAFVESRKKVAATGELAAEVFRKSRGQICS